MQMRIPFTKMHGCGNDYIYVNAMQHPIADPARVAIALSDRHKGIGSDGLVLIDRSPIPEADFSMRIFNADGSEAMMCGNASRCIGKYLYERGLIDKTTVSGSSTYIRLLTLSGVKTLELHVKHSIVESVTVDMGKPVFEDESQFLPSRDIKKGVFVSMGNPHYVIFTKDIDQVGDMGQKLEINPAFPQRCNIEFAAPLLSPLGGTTNSLAADNLLPQGGGREGAFRVRVWERGSGITMACGTGACATAVAACMTGKAGRHSQIVMDGGILDIEWRESDNHVYMTGPAEFVFDGEVSAP
jgi:diaminopimelate epimerase